MQKYKQFLGVDFSGGKNAGNKIWVSRGIIYNGSLRIISCDRVSELDTSCEREPSLKCLRGIIEKSGGVVGLDFPFGIPRSLVRYTQWETFARQFGKNYPDEFEFRKKCFEAAGRKELKRLTDDEMKTPFCTYNLRLYRQTYFGIRDVLAPLVEEELICVAPMQSIAPGKPLVVEICPASTLKTLGLYVQYKGKAPEHRHERAHILSELESRKLVSVESKLMKKLLDDTEGDALDSVVATLAAFRAPGQISRNAGSSKVEYLMEGFVYV